MLTAKDVLQRIVDESGLSLRDFAESHGNWDHAHLARILKVKGGKSKSIGPAVVGRLLVHLNEQTAAELIAAYLADQKRLIEEQRQRFASAAAQASEAKPQTAPAATVVDFDSANKEPATMAATEAPLK